MTLLRARCSDLIIQTNRARRLSSEGRDDTEPGGRVQKPIWGRDAPDLGGLARVFDVKTIVAYIADHGVRPGQGHRLWVHEPAPGQERPVRSESPTDSTTNTWHNCERKG